MYNIGFKGSFKAVPIYVYKPCSFRKRTLGSISCNPTTSRPLRPIPYQLSALGVTPGLRLIIKLQLLIGARLIPNICLLTRDKRNNEEQSGPDYRVTEQRWPSDSRPKENDTSRHAKNSTPSRLKSSPVAIRCIVTTGGIGESEEHDCQFEESPIRLEGSFPLVSFFDPYVIEPFSNVDL